MAGFGTSSGWSDDPVRAAAFRDLALAVSGADTYTSAIEVAAEPMSVGLRAAVMIGLLDAARGVVHALGISDPDPTRAVGLNQLFDTPFERGGFIERVLTDHRPIVTEIEDEFIRENWPAHKDVALDFGLRHMVIAPLMAQDDARGVIWAARSADEREFETSDGAFTFECGRVLGLAVYAGYLQEALQRAAGRRTPAIEPAQPLPERPERRRETVLSERERAVLRLLAAGYTNREAADDLSLSVRTVEWHRARIQWKLGVSGRADLTKAARDYGV